MLSKIHSGIYLTLVAVASAHLIAGCSEKAAGTAANEDPGVSFEPVSFEQFEQHRQAYASKVLVVDLWATWCIPCLERFPKMVSLHHKYKAQGVQLMSLSLDDREDQASVDFAAEFLIKQNAVFPNYLLDENIIDGFDMIGVQTVPAVNIYDQSGKLYRQLNNNDPSNQFSEADIEAVILSLLR